MCRFIVYHGPSIQLSQVVIDPDHGMLQQSIKAYCSHTPVNADGFGISWYGSESATPGLFKDKTPAWNNPNLRQMTKAVKSKCFFAHVRAASAGGVNYPNCHPFCYKNLTFMHNGTVAYYRFIKRSLVSLVSERAYQLIQGTTDSEVMFALFVTNFERLIKVEGNDFHQLPGHGIEDPYPYIQEGTDHTHFIATAIQATLRQVHFLVLEHEYKTGVQTRPENAPTADQILQQVLTLPELDGAAPRPDPLPETVAIGRLNLAVADGRSTCSARYVSSAPETAHSLFVATGSRVVVNNHTCTMVPTTPGSKRPGASECVIVSSEPLSAEPGYQCELVPVNHMVLTGPNGYVSVDPCF